MPTPCTMSPTQSHFILPFTRCRMLSRLNYALCRNSEELLRRQSAIYIIGPWDVELVYQVCYYETICSVLPVKLVFHPVTMPSTSQPVMWEFGLFDICSNVFRSPLHIGVFLYCDLQYADTQNSNKYNVLLMGTHLHVPSSLFYSNV